MTQKIMIVESPDRISILYGVYLKLTWSGPRGLIIKRVEIFWSCTELVTKFKARRIVRDHVRNHNIPGQKCRERVRTILMGSRALVYKKIVFGNYIS